MILLAWLSASLYLIIRGVVLMVKGVALMLFYSVLFVGWACAMGVALFSRLLTARRRPV